MPVGFLCFGVYLISTDDEETDEEEEENEEDGEENVAHDWDSGIHVGRAVVGWKGEILLMIERGWNYEGGRLVAW